MNIVKKLFRPKTIALQPGGMISALFAYHCVSDRLIVADDLSAFDEKIVQDVLIYIASDPREDIELRKVCAESLGEIWWRNDIFDKTLLTHFVSEVRHEFDQEYNALQVAKPNNL